MVLDLHESASSKRHLDRFIRLWIRYARHVDRQTQTAEFAARAAIGRIDAVRVMRPKKRNQMTAKSWPP